MLRFSFSRGEGEEERGGGPLGERQQKQKTSRFLIHFTAIEKLWRQWSPVLSALVLHASRAFSTVTGSTYIVIGFLSYSSVFFFVLFFFFPLFFFHVMLYKLGAAHVERALHAKKKSVGLFNSVSERKKPYTYKQQQQQQQKKTNRQRTKSTSAEKTKIASHHNTFTSFLLVQTQNWRVRGRGGGAGRKRAFQPRRRRKQTNNQTTTTTTMKRVPCKQMKTNKQTTTTTTRKKKR